MTNQQGAPEALRLAEILEGDYCPDWLYERGVDEVSAELRTQHARITELEAQLAQRFDAADMATAAAQGFRDGVTSAPHGQAPAALFDERGFRDWVVRNLPNNTIIGSSAYWADHLTAWAKRFVKSSDIQQAPAQAADSVLEDAARESEYQRGYRHGYEQRDAEVRGALA